MSIYLGSYIPKHIAIIMDGNGRWAQKQGMARVFGHQHGATRVKEVVEECGQIGVDFLSLYAFSEENWSRPKEEVDALFLLLSNYLRSEASDLHKNNVKVIVIGQRERIPTDCVKLIDYVEELTRDNDGLKLVLAISYSGRSELVECCKSVAKRVDQGLLSPDLIDQNIIESFLPTADIPDPDLLIRTSGEQRISNFFLWQMAYTEFLFVPICWPDFSRNDLRQAIQEYQARNRKFGGITSENLPIKEGREDTL